MSLSWGGRRYRPAAPTTRVSSNNNTNKFRRGPVLTGSFIQPNQEEETPLPPVETFHILTEDGSPLLTEGGDFLDFDFV